ncbi:DNA-binding response regulator [Bacillus freudenreichii]|nr:DNA-binding response regulator [Bacillus freudenreichii]
MNVLIVDDEPIELEQLEFLVHSHYPTWNLYKAPFGSTAIKIAENMVNDDRLIQLALMDIKLPGSNGLEVAARLKVLMPDMEIVIISAFQSFEYAKQSIHLKVMDYLVKPVIEQELINVLQAFLTEHPEYDNYTTVVREVLELVKNNFREPLKLSVIADTLHINVSYLSRLFREEVGVNFSDYLLNLRIEHAKRLLIQNKNWTISHIADECGFNSQHYFSNAFKKIVECTPKEYRSKKVV